MDLAEIVAQNAIDQATDNVSVDTAKSNGVNTINNIQPKVVKKDEAKAVIDNAARTKKQK